MGAEHSQGNDTQGGEVWQACTGAVHVGEPIVDGRTAMCGRLAADSRPALGGRPGLGGRPAAI